jgi:hypothetical protein
MWTVEGNDLPQTHDLMDSSNYVLFCDNPRWDDNIKMDLREIRCEIVGRISVAQDRGQWQALVITVTKLLVP